MVMIGKEFLFLTKRMITHFFSLMRTVSKSNYSCMLAISFSIDTKFSPINSSGLFFLQSWALAGLLFPLRCGI